MKSHDWALESPHPWKGCLRKKSCKFDSCSWRMVTLPVSEIEDVGIKYFSRTDSNVSWHSENKITGYSLAGNDTILYLKSDSVWAEKSLYPESAYLKTKNANYIANVVKYENTEDGSKLTAVFTGGK